jgi:tripartite-type tricarboxylate transporter receptor subunit TctC
MKSICFSVLALAAAVAGMPAYGQGGADKPITVIVPFTPGGGTDILSRLITPKLAEKLGTSGIVENKPGASGAIAAQFTAKAAPDGKTLMMGSTSEIGINPGLYPKLPYDVMRDFAPVTAVA